MLYKLFILFRMVIIIRGETNNNITNIINMYSLDHQGLTMMYFPLKIV